MSPLNFNDSDHRLPRPVLPKDSPVNMRTGLAGRIAAAFMDSKLTPLLIMPSLFEGLFAVMITPREEEPQIKVPMVDIQFGMPGASAAEIEKRLVDPAEKLLYEINGVEYLYSISQPSGGIIIARFQVGTDPDAAVERIHSKLAGTMDAMPEGAMPPLVKLRTIDDVPALAYTLWGDGKSPAELRAAAEELRAEIKRHPRIAKAWTIGGDTRTVTVAFDAARLAAYNSSLLQAWQALEGANWRLPAGSVESMNTRMELSVGGFLRDRADVEGTVLGVYGGRPVYLRDVATITDGPGEAENYVWMGSGPGAEHKPGLRPGVDTPAVTIALAKKPGTNAVELVQEIDALVARLSGTLIPGDITITKTRDYGFTAGQKSNELIFHTLLATLSVVLLMWLMLGRKEATVVLVAVPVTLALTLASSWAFGYTLNRVTLFALIFSIGILVDDAIVVVENIHRHTKLNPRYPIRATILGTDEVGNPTILATFTVIAALMPLAFVRGLMGPYMRPIPVNASAAMFFSLLVAFIITPWLAYRLFKNEKVTPADGHHLPDTHEHEDSPEWIRRLYHATLKPLIASRPKRWLVLGGVFGVLLLSFLTIPSHWLIVKMMPYDNKSELQVVIDAPENYPLERTNAAARELAAVFRDLPEVTDYQVYVGSSSPFNFNGLVRYYFMRDRPWQADIQVNLLDKEDRDQASHDFAKSVRPLLLPIAERHGVNIKVSEVPPGPPVLSTMVAEIYGPTLEGRLSVAEQVRSIFSSTQGIVDTDWMVEDAVPREELHVDHEKAIRHGISVEQVVRTLRLATAGAEAGRLHVVNSREEVPIVLRLAREQRSSVDDLLRLRVHAANGAMVPLSELVRRETLPAERYIYHKNLQPVTYVTAELAGTEESPVYGILQMKEAIADVSTPDGTPLNVMSTHLPQDRQAWSLKWDGEWHITYEVFRDMGIAFGVVMILIYVLVVGWFKSFVTPIIIMTPIPLTLIGILPGHAILGVFFTATSMIGFIALAGVIVRNSILLVDFINIELRKGRSLEDAVLSAGSVRFRPILLTALALVVGAGVIYLDPIFQGLAVSLIGGVMISTLLTLIVIPLMYYMYLSTVGTAMVMGSTAMADENSQED